MLPLPLREGVGGWGKPALTKSYQKIATNPPIRKPFIDLSIHSHRKNDCGDEWQAKFPPPPSPPPPQNR
jgi:hypothetical protein